MSPPAPEPPLAPCGPTVLSHLPCGGGGGLPTCLASSILPQQAPTLQLLQLPALPHGPHLSRGAFANAVPTAWIPSPSLFLARVLPRELTLLPVGLLGLTQLCLLGSRLCCLHTRRGLTPRMLRAGHCFADPSHGKGTPCCPQPSVLSAGLFLALPPAELRPGQVLRPNQ